MRGNYQTTKLHSFFKRLLIFLLLLLPLISFNPLFTQIRPAYASPSLGAWESFASAYRNNTEGTLHNAADGFDRKDYYPTYETWKYTYADFEIKDDRWFEVTGWDYSGGTIDHVNFTAIWEVTGITTGSNPDEYRIFYVVDPDATESVLMDWQTGDQAKTTTTWKETTDPDGGSWTETKVNSINFTVDTRHNGGHDHAIFNVWELYLTVGYTPPTVSIKPASTVDSTIFPMTSTILRPDGAGSVDQWDGDYTDFDEAVQNGDTDYINCSINYKQELATFQNHGSETWDIGGVRLVVWARMNETDSDPEKINLRLRIGTKTYKGPNYPLTTTWTEYSDEWAVNPDTGVNWTWTDIDGLEAGVRSYLGDDSSWTGEMRVTQMYLEVVGERYQVDVHIDNVVNLWGWEFELTFDNSILHGVNWETVTDPVYVDPFLSSSGGTIFSAPGPGFDNTAGTLSLTAACLMETDVGYLVDGSGDIASVGFTVVGVGPTDITLGAESGITEGTRGESLTIQLVDGSFDNTGAVPEFPFGAVAEIALLAVFIYLWWRTKHNHKSPEVTASHKLQ